MKRFTIFSFVMFLFGFLLSASYFALLFYSGDPLHDDTVFEIRKDSITRAASEARQDPERYQAMQLEVTREMNPVSLSCMYEAKKSSGRSEYTVEVISPDQSPLTSFDLRIRKSKSGSSNTGKTTTAGSTVTGIKRIGSFSADQEGVHTIRVRPQDRQGLAVIRMEIHARRNARTPSMALLFAGAGLGFLGMMSGMASILFRAVRTSAG